LLWRISRDIASNRLSGKFDVAQAIAFQRFFKLTPRELEGRVMPFLKLTASG